MVNLYNFTMYFQGVALIIERVKQTETIDHIYYLLILSRLLRRRLCEFFRIIKR